VISWFLLISLQNRNPIVLQGGDILLRMLAFWAMFVPLNAYFSLDRALDTSGVAPPRRPLSAGTLELVNPTSAPIKVTIDPVDGMTTDTLGSAYQGTSVGEHGSTAWVRVDQRSVAIPAHSHQSVKVGMSVPASATPGDYLAGVAVEVLGQDRAARVTKGVQIGEVTRYAIGIELKLPGVRHAAIHFTGASLFREPSGLAFLLDASNYGNVILKGVHGWVRVSTGPRRVAAFPIEAGTFVSGTSIQYPVLARREDPPPGTEYRVQAELIYAGGVAYLDTRLQFSHAAAVTQQSYGGRKLPHAQVGRDLGVALLLLIILGGFVAVPVVLRRRRRPLSRAAGIARLDDYLVTMRPLSVARITAGTTTMNECRMLDRNGTCENSVWKLSRLKWFGRP